MVNTLTSRIKQLSPSATLAVDATVKKLQAEGETIYNLSLGEPDFSTPTTIQNAAIKAMRDGFTHYTATAGIPKLREAIAAKFQAENNISYDPSQIIVGVGSKQLLYNALLVLVEKGDEVIIATPTWSTYVEQVKLAEGKAILVPLKPPFKLTAKDIERNITKKTKVIMLNSPANPTGAVIEKKELEAIARLVIENNIWIVSDEIYEKLLYGATHVSIASLNKRIYERTITINGFSKSYAMTGWRIGYAGGPKEIIKAMADLQSQTTSNTSSIAQYAGIEALKGSQKSIEKMAQAFSKRRVMLLREFSKIPEVQVIEPEGAFYLFFDVAKLLNKKQQTSSDWCEALLAKEHVALVPGEAFLCAGWVRLSFAASMETLEEGMKRIRRFTATIPNIK